MSHINTEANINIRINADIKGTLTRAAALSQKSISAFLLEAAFERAKSILEEYETITLSNVERDRFFALLDSSDEPNETLQAAMKEYLKEYK